MLRLTPSKSHFQLWRTAGADQSQGFYFGTHTHAEGGRREGGGLQSVFVCGHLCGQRNYGEEHFMYINAAFKVTNLSQSSLVLNRCGCSSCFQNWSSNPIPVKSLCLCRSVCVSASISLHLLSHVTGSHSESLYSSLSAQGFWDTLLAFIKLPRAVL